MMWVPEVCVELLRDLCPYAVVTSRSRLSSEAFCYISGPHEMSPVVTIEFGTKCTEGLATTQDVCSGNQGDHSLGKICLFTTAY